MRNRINELLRQYRSVKDQIVRTEAERKSSRKSLKDHQSALDAVRSIIKTVQEHTHIQLASRVTQCLAAVYEDSYTFKIVMEAKRGQTEARIMFERDGMEFDPLREVGGGVIDVAAFALRLSCILMHKPPLRRLMVMDEPFKFVSRDVLPRVAMMLERLAEELDFQFIMVTHLTALQIGQIYEVE